MLKALNEGLSEQGDGVDDERTQLGCVLGHHGEKWGKFSRRTCCWFQTVSQSFVRAAAVSGCILCEPSRRSHL